MGIQQWKNYRNISIWGSVSICVLLSVISVLQLREHQSRSVDLSLGHRASFAGPHIRQQRGRSIMSTVDESSSSANTEMLNGKKDQEDDQENADLQVPLP